MSEVKYTEEEIEKIKDRILEALEMVIDPEFLEKKEEAYATILA